MADDNAARARREHAQACLNLAGEITVAVSRLIDIKPPVDGWRWKHSEQLIRARVAMRNALDAVEDAQ